MGPTFHQPIIAVPPQLSDYKSKGDEYEFYDQFYDRKKKQFPLNIKF